jgi:hypothetical protein
VEDTISFYKLATAGYHHVWRRLRDHPLVTEKEIILHAQADYKREAEIKHPFRGWNSLVMCATSVGSNERPGSAVTRALQTSLRVGVLLLRYTKRLDEGVRWMGIAYKGTLSLYGPNSRETFNLRETMVHAYRQVRNWTLCLALGQTMFQAELDRRQYVSLGGADLGLLIGDCHVGLGQTDAAASWYALSHRVRAGWQWRNRSGLEVASLLKLATVEGLHHDHEKSLRLAHRGLSVYHKHHSRFPRDETLLNCETVIAMQLFQLGKATEAKELSEQAIQRLGWYEDERAYSKTYESRWDTGLKAIWVWGCAEFGQGGASPEWEIGHLQISKELCKEAIEKFGPLNDPCCSNYRPGDFCDWRTARLDKILGILEDVAPR